MGSPTSSSTSRPRRPAALAQAVALARPGGTIVLAGTRGSAETPGFWPDHVVYKELRILGALGVDAPAYRAALDLLASGRYPFADLPRRRAGLDGADALLRAMAGEGDAPAARPRRDHPVAHEVAVAVRSIRR